MIVGFRPNLGERLVHPCALFTKHRHRLSVFVPVVQVLAALFLSLAGVVLFGVAVLQMLQISSGLLQQI